MNPEDLAELLAIQQRMRQTQYEPLEPTLRMQQMQAQSNRNRAALMGRVPGAAGGVDGVAAMLVEKRRRDAATADPQSARWRQYMAYQPPEQQAPAAPQYTDRQREMAQQMKHSGSYAGKTPSAGYGVVEPAHVRAARQGRQADARSAQRTASIQRAFARGRLNPAAAAMYAEQGLLPNFADAQAERMAMIAAAGNRDNTDPVKSGMAQWINHPVLGPYIAAGVMPPDEVVSQVIGGGGSAPMLPQGTGGLKIRRPQRRIGSTPVSPMAKM